MDANIVENWLRSLNMVQYTQSFLDNGYDDLEICKQIGPEDLDAIGVIRADHREEVLAAVQHLREHGGTAVYFTLDPEYQRVNGLASYNCPARGLSYVQRSLDLEHGVVTRDRTANGVPFCLESGASGDTNATIHTSTTSPNLCPVHSNYVENSILGNVSVCATNGYDGGHGSPGGSQPGSGNITPAWLSPTHRPLTVPLALINGGGVHGSCSSLPQPQHPLPPPPPPPPPPLGGFPSINSARVGVPLPPPPCQTCLAMDLSPKQKDFPPCSVCPVAGTLPLKESHLEGKQTLVTFTRLQLTAILRDKLEVDSIALTEEKYLKKSDSHQYLERLSRQYADDLNTHTQDVFLQLLEIQESHINSNGHDSSPERDSVNGETEPCRMFSVYGQANRSVPPPLPSCPPPSTLYEDPDCLSVLKRESPSHSSRSPLLPPARQNSEEGPIEYPLGEIDLRKKGLTLGRLFRKKPPKKYVYKQYEGDLNASEITMPDEERIELMLLVKEGKLSMHEAVEKVKRYEKQKRDEFLREKEREGDKRPC